MKPIFPSTYAHFLIPTGEVEVDNVDVLNRIHHAKSLYLAHLPHLGSDANTRHIICDGLRIPGVLVPLHAEYLFTRRLPSLNHPYSIYLTGAVTTHRATSTLAMTAKEYMEMTSLLHSNNVPCSATPATKGHIVEYIFDRDTAHLFYAKLESLGFRISRN